MAGKNAAERRAAQWAEHRRQREEEDRRQRVTVITEFDAGDPDATMHALAGEILRYRDVLRLLAKAIGWAEAGAPFGLVAPPLDADRDRLSGPDRVNSHRRRRGSSATLVQ